MSDETPSIPAWHLRADADGIGPRTRGDEPAAPMIVQHDTNPATGSACRFR